MYFRVIFLILFIANILTAPLGLIGELFSGFSIRSISEQKLKGTMEKEDCEDREAEDSEESKFELYSIITYNLPLQSTSLRNFFTCSSQSVYLVILEKVSPPPKSC